MEPFPLANRRVVDLTHALTPDFPTFDGKPQLTLRVVGRLASDGFNFSEWTMNEHTGTHLDAPWHKSNGPSADRILAAQLVGPLVVVDIRERAAADADAVLAEEDLERWEGIHGQIPRGAVVAMLSGWDALVQTHKFRNPDPSGTLHFPGFQADAVEFLLHEREVIGIAVDTLSLDPGNSKDYPVHTRWLGSGRWGVECVANLADVPPSGATVVVGGPKVAGASGGPCRVLAFV